MEAAVCSYDPQIIVTSAFGGGGEWRERSKGWGFTCWLQNTDDNIGSRSGRELGSEIYVLEMRGGTQNPS